MAGLRKTWITKLLDVVLWRNKIRMILISYDFDADGYRIGIGRVDRPDVLGYLFVTNQQMEKLRDNVEYEMNRRAILRGSEDARS